MTMFARSVFRAAAPVRQQYRKYATESATSAPQGSQSTASPPPSGGGGGSSSTILLMAAAVGIGAGGYYYFTNSGSSVAAKKAEEKVQDAANKVGLPASGPRAALTGGDQGFVSLRLDDVEIINHNTKRFRFKLPEEDMVSGLHVASAVLAKYKPEGAEKPVIRPYTPISDEDTKGYMDLMIKKYENGPMSTHLHDMVPGQRLDIKGPLPKYPWAENKHSHIGLIAGGTGITPMFQLCRAIFNNPSDKTKVTLVVGNVSEEDVLLKNELAHLENTFPNRFRAFYVLDNPPKEWTGAKGYINKDLLKTVLPEPKTENIKLFVCGPPGMMKSISGDKKSPRDQGELVGILKDLGYTPEQVYKF